MAIITWRQNPTVVEALVKEAPDFDFEQAVTILEQIQNNKTPLGEGSDPSLEALEIKSHVSLANPAAELYNLKFTKSKKPTIWTNFISLAGIQGPLPMPYTEIVLQRTKQKDYAFRDFLDLFNHRLASLWYRLRKKYKVSLSPVRPEQHAFGRTLLQLAGIQNFKVQGDIRDSLIHQRVLLTYNDLLWKKCRSAEGLKCFLESYFQTSVHLDLFKGQWKKALFKDLSFIGHYHGQYNSLGHSLVLGRQTWDQSASVMICFKSLSWKMYQSFLPKYDKKGKSNLDLLKEFCRLYCGQQVNLKIRLSLAAHEVRSLSLSGKFALGLNSWLNSKNSEQDFSAEVSLG